MTPDSKHESPSGLRLHTSNPSKIRQSLGGVGRNVAIACQHLGVPARLCSIVGSDLWGETALKILSSQGLSAQRVKQALGSQFSTAQYVAINDANRELFIAAADMTVLENVNTMGIDESNYLKKLSQWIDCTPSWLVVDANWNSAVTRWWMETGKALGARVAFEPVSIAKSTRIMEGSQNSSKHASLPVYPNHLMDLMTPNQFELKAMFESLRASEVCEHEGWFKIIDSFALSGALTPDRLIALTNTDLVSAGVPQQSIQLLPFVPCIMTTLGSQGVLVSQLLHRNDARLASPEVSPYLLSCTNSPETSVGGVYLRLFPSVEHVRKESVCSVNGAGDTFLGALIAAAVRRPDKNIEDLVDFAQSCAVMSMRSEEAVSPEIKSLRLNDP